MDLTQDDLRRCQQHQQNHSEPPPVDPLQLKDKKIAQLNQEVATLRGELEAQANALVKQTESAAGWKRKLEVSESAFEKQAQELTNIEADLNMEMNRRLEALKAAHQKELRKGGPAT